MYFVINNLHSYDQQIFKLIMTYLKKALPARKKFFRLFWPKIRDLRNLERNARTAFNRNGAKSGVNFFFLICRLLIWKHNV